MENNIKLNKEEMVNANGETTAKFRKKEFEAKSLRKLYAIKDKISGKFLNITEKVNDMTALRELDVLMRQKEPSLIKMRPADYAMYRLAIMDEETGEIESDIAKIGEAVDYVEREDN